MSHEVTLEGLLRHADKFGLDIKHKDTKRVKATYGSWKQLREDSIVHVGLGRLGLDDLRRLVDGLGYGKFTDDAEEAWKDMRGLSDDS